MNSNTGCPSRAIPNDAIPWRSAAQRFPQPGGSGLPVSTPAGSAAVPDRRLVLGVVNASHTSPGAASLVLARRAIRSRTRTHAKQEHATTGGAMPTVRP